MCIKAYQFKIVYILTSLYQIYHVHNRAKRKFFSRIFNNISRKDKLHYNVWYIISEHNYCDYKEDFILSLHI